MAESKIFSDENLGPPKKWKGKCQQSSNFTCNNKIIGARDNWSDRSSPEVPSPLDTDGHGSQAASIAAGAILDGANMLELGFGDARGGIPGARLAVYKMCWIDGCSNADVISAYDDVIADRVVIISISLATSLAVDYFIDPIAIGSFHAMKHGILTSTAAGNYGPIYGSVSSVAPWTLSLAARTIDRKFVTKVKLGNEEIYKGWSMNTFDLKEDLYPFIYTGEAGLKGVDARNCYPDCLDKKKVKGKIVLCEDMNTGMGLLDAGAADMVMQNGSFDDVAYDLLLASFPFEQRKKPTAKIFKSNEEKDRLSPSVASFSSSGPNLITHDILKPDLTGPGFSILGAWSEANTMTGTPWDRRVVSYNIYYGTSISCPHASGAAAYIKSFHPKWSPAGIKSALITTAFPKNPAVHPDNELAYGAGHINPVNATNPGLVSDAEETDYVEFLCGQGYDNSKILLFTERLIRCSKEINATVWDLNCPSFTLSTLHHDKPTTRVFHRTLTNVGSAVSTYKAVLTAPKGLTIKVTPSTLSFASPGEKKSFVVNVTVTVAATTPVISGSLTWDR